jgi:dolichyl-phosphate beta-glucosyltransferase
MDARTPVWGRDRRLTSLVFPTYNPGPQIEQAWREVQQFLSQAPGRWEVLFVCDGCTDGTPRLLRRLTAGAADVQVLSHEPNRGKGFAVRTGLAAARGQWRLFTDVDLAYRFEDVRRLANALRNGADLAIGSRTHPDSRMVLPAALQGYLYRRHLQSSVLAVLVRHLLALPYRDTQAGLKGLTAGAARRLLPQLTCDGFGFDCELLSAGRALGLAIAEVPVCVRYEDRASTTGFSGMARMVRELWRVRRTWCGARERELEPATPAQRREAA